MFLKVHRVMTPESQVKNPTTGNESSWTRIKKIILLARNSVELWLIHHLASPTFQSMSLEDIAIECV